MNNSLNNFIINFKQRLSSSMLAFYQQQSEKVYKNFLCEYKNFKFHAYKALIIILLSVGAIFITNFHIISLSEKTKNSIEVCSWLFIIFMTLELVINSVAIFFKYRKYRLYVNFIKNQKKIENLIDQYLNNQPKSATYYQFSSYLKFEDFNSHISEDEVALLLNLPLDTNQKQYLYQLIAKKGISLADLEHLQSIKVSQLPQQKNLYLVK